MLLNEVVQVSGACLSRNGSYENLGFISDSRDEMLVFLSDPRFLANLLKNHAVSAVIATPELANKVPSHLALATSEMPKLSFARIHNHLCRSNFYWNDFDTSIDETAQVHPTAWVAEKNVRIGAGTIVGARCTVLERCEIGSHCVVGAGCILGGVGFQTVPDEGDTLLEMAHAGGLRLRDRVHVLPGAVLATGLFRHYTDIGDEARIGSQAFVSHGVQVGRASFVGHGSVVNGNVVIGEHVWIGPGATVAHNLRVANNAVISLGAVVIRDVEEDTRVSGNFAEPHRALLRRMAVGASQV